VLVDTGKGNWICDLWEKCMRTAISVVYGSALPGVSTHLDGLGGPIRVESADDT